MKTILYLTDLYYEAKGRQYYQEDLLLTSRLTQHFNILIGHPQQAIANLQFADCVVFRNTGPVIGYEDYFRQFLAAVRENNITTFNSFDGKADIRGKQYLLDLSNAGLPVIPTINNVSELERLGNADKFITKIINGADSIGMETLTRAELLQARPEGKLIQPFLELEYEVSFYYLNDEFQYALYAPDKLQRWNLHPYHPSSGDLAFADRFIRWNNIKHGITRVDACRLNDNSMLLVELEDLNPFLSVEVLDDATRNTFINNWIKVLKSL